MNPSNILSELKQRIQNNLQFIEKFYSRWPKEKKS